MKRLTTNKAVSDMSMVELAHNSCYADSQHNARYRDYELDIDSRQFVRDLAKDMFNEDLSELTDEEFEEYMGEMLAVEIDSTIGLLAVFYRNLWAMADLRERLKVYEDAEEQGLLLLFPCKIGDMLFCIEEGKVWDCILEKITVSRNNGTRIEVSTPESMPDICAIEYTEYDIGNTVFLKQEEAEKKLKELEVKDETAKEIKAE